MAVRARLAVGIAGVIALSGVVAPSAGAAGSYVADPNSYQAWSYLDLRYSHPRGISALDGIAAVAGDTTPTVSVFTTCNPKSCTLGDLQTMPAGSAPADTAVVSASGSSVDSRVFASNSGAGTLTVVPYSSGGVEPQLTMTVGGEPTGLAASADGRWLFVADHANNALIAYNAQTLVKWGTETVGIGPWGVAVDPQAHFVYVANNGSGSVSVIDMTDYDVVATIPVGANPGDLAIDPAGKRLYVANNGDGTVSVIDLATRLVVGTVAVGSQPWGVAATSTHVFVANYGDGTVSVISAATGAIVATIKTGNNPFGVALDADRDVLVSNYGSGTISQINLHARTPDVAWSSTRATRTVRGSFRLEPAVSYRIVARKGAITRSGSCAKAASGVDGTCSIRLPRGTWRVSVQSSLPWQPVPLGQQNKRFVF